jgi:hypothetical protein
VFDADLQDVDRTSGAEWLLTSSSISSRGMAGGGRADASKTETVFLYSLPGVGAFFVRGKSFALPAGFRMVWKTRGSKQGQ